MTAETVTECDGVRVERVVTHGTFELDGGSWEVDNNVWIVGDDSACVVIDAAHRAEPILEAVGDRELGAVLATHGHNDHVNAVGELLARTQASSYLHPQDRMLWDELYAFPPDHELHDGQTIEVAGVELDVVHTPGHSPGAVCFLAPALGVVFTGDTLFEGGPGATGGRSFSDYDRIVDSITTRLFTLPAGLTVLTGHGDATTIGAELARRGSWTRPDGA